MQQSSQAVGEISLVPPAGDGEAGDQVGDSSATPATCTTDHQRVQLGGTARVSQQQDQSQKLMLTGTASVICQAAGPAMLRSIVIAGLLAYGPGHRFCAGIPRPWAG